MPFIVEPAILCESVCRVRPRAHGDNPQPRQRDPEQDGAGRGAAPSAGRPSAAPPPPICVTTAVWRPVCCADTLPLAERGPAAEKGRRNAGSCRGSSRGGKPTSGGSIVSEQIGVSTRVRRVPWCVFLTPFIAGAPAYVLAQQQAPGGSAESPSSGQSGNLEEVIVTAEFRATNVQDTPLAITAVNSQMLEARSQTNLAQITAQAPNVSLRPAGSAFGSALVAYIRGIGQTDFNPSVEPGVAIYVDDVYYSTITGNLLDLLDLDRVEVLRGPQGTLAGRNAIGGAIKLFTRKPDGTDDADVAVTKGAYNRTEIKGAAGFTIVPDKLFARVAGIARSMDGYVTRLDYACANHTPPPGTPGGLPTYAQTFGCDLGTEGGQSYAAGRLSLRWEATDKFSLDFATSIVNDNSESQPGVLVQAFDHSGSNFPWRTPNGPVPFPPFASDVPNNPTFSPTASTTVPIFYDNNRNGVFDAGDVPYDNRFATDGKLYNYATYIDDGTSLSSPLFQGGVPGENSDVFKPYVIDPVNTLSSWDASVNLNWQITDKISLLSVSAYRTYDNLFAEDTDGSPLAVQQLLQRLKHTQKTQELRASIALDRVDLTFGAFYLDQETNEDARVDLPYVGFDFFHGPDQVPAKNKAVYGQAALHLTDRTDLSLGVRYSKDEKSYTFHRHNPDFTDVQPCTTFWFWEAENPANCGVFGLNGLSVKYSSNNTDWRVALSHNVSDATMFYVQASTGYRAGGNNARPFFPSQNHAFKPETLDSYEFGVKTTLSGAARLNAAVFSNTYNDIQLPTTLCYWAPPAEQNPCASQDNIGDADVWGVEFEAEWNPTARLSIDGTYSHLNFDYTNVSSLSPVTKDMITPYTPENKASVGLQYEFGLAGGGSVTPRVDVAYTDQVFANAVNAPTNLIDAYTLVNARLTWRSASNAWQVA
ncbi:MAG TPA: TonB-dependent receptor, partial [Gammaproteobacteria bacterium]|nr:TonB-dependent receptor [Gammaproteobacteria bacterium]